MTRYVVDDLCPVCDRTIRRRPVELTGRPCPTCGEQWLTPQDRYRLRNARLTPATTRDIINAARTRRTA